MHRITANNTDPIARARKAADQVIDRQPVSFEPSNHVEARAAVQRLGEHFEQLPAAFAEALDGASDSASLLSSDSLQGLAEIVQNADDARASVVRIQLRPTELLASHNGDRVHLSDVLAFATPWLTNKVDDADAIGRFGIGLSTLRSLSNTLEVHCAPFHVRIGDPWVAPIGQPVLPPGFREPGWTTLRVPVEHGTIGPPSLEHWFSQWDDSALLFLRNVSRVSLLDPDGGTTLQLELNRRSVGDLIVSPELPVVSREHVSTSGSRSWTTYSAEVPVPPDVQRAGKATGLTTLISVAFPHDPTETGQIYAGLPVVRTRSPYFVNAQFDPVTSRGELANNSWNESLIVSVAEVWSVAALDLFRRDPHVAWHAMPLTEDAEEGPRESVTRSLEKAVVHKARQTVASRLSFPVPGQGRLRLSQLAIETQPLEGILQDSETARLAGLSAALPASVRDPVGRWRLVLDDWRSHGADLPEEVGVEQALELFGDESRSVTSSIALVAIALEEGFRTELLQLPCLIARDGRRLIPPTADSVKAVSAESAGLAAQLGITTLLHSAHLSPDCGAPEVLEWLQQRGALLNGADDTKVLRRLAAAGRSGHSIETPLTDEQVRDLRDAFERLDHDTRDELGPDVGQAIRLESYSFDGEGQKKFGAARPHAAYLPRAIESRTDSFAAAAETTPGPVWLSEQYARVLRSDAGREGLGAQKLLRLLGAETAPRLRFHPQLQRRYPAEPQRGLPRSLATVPNSRLAAMQEREATFTLEDRDSPDLLAVVADISRDRHGKQRRRRASALLSALGRAWDRQLSDYAEVDAASDYYGWNLKGKIPAFWLAQAGDVAWLDDESGKARRPAELRVRTPGTEALYGRDSSDYLHADLDQQTRRTFLAALGISGDPSRSELVGRLRDLQSMPRPSQTVSNSLRQESETVYRALARSPAPGSTDSDLNRRQLRREFARHRLILVDESWLAPSAVFAGPPIFGDLRPFAPATRECELLWRELGLKTPSAKDCVAVIKELTYRRRRGPDRTEQAVLLETMRTLAEQLAQGDIVQREKLRRLALWTSTGWERDRPVYVTDNPVLAAGLGDRLSIWQPGGELEQFRSLLEPLRVSEIRADDSRVTDPEFALLDHSLTEHFRRALALLRDELQRNLPDLAHGITTSWDDLAEHAVKVHPTLQLTVCLTTGDEYSCATNAIVDSALATVFVADAAALGHVDGGGRALAALFEVERRRVALEWSAACDRAAEGSDVLSIELARDRVAREEREFGDRSRLVSTPINAGRDNRVVTRPADRGEAIDENGEQSASHFAGAPRTLVDPELYEIVDTEGRVIQGQQARRPSVERNMARGSGELVEPIRISRAPQSRLPLRGFSGVDRENVGFEFFRTALGSNGREIIDVRTQRNVGADAVDEYDNFYELKVFAGPEPNDVTLTASEVQRARTAQSFFLVVVSSIEGDGARPTVRLIADPLQRLHPTDRGTITLSGVRELDNPVYKFASVADQ